MKEKPVTIKDIARRLGISYSTVSRALSPHASHLVKEGTRKIVQQAAREMNYSPNLLARNLLKGGGGILGLLTYDVSMESFRRHLHHFLDIAADYGYQIVVAAVADSSSQRLGDDQVKQIRQLESYGVDGFLINTRGDEAESVQVVQAVNGKLPVETFPYKTGNANGAALDHASGFFEMTCHLIALGHEKICFLGADWTQANGPSAMGKGYLMAMRANGLPPSRVDVETNRTDSGYLLGRELGRRYTALVCCCDNTALGVCKGLADAGLRVPDDVAVTGYGDLDVSAYVFPALTTLSIPYEEIARVAIQNIVGQIQHAVNLRQRILKPTLVVRESCGANRIKKIIKTN